jgi:hypothetical protein
MLLVTAHLKLQHGGSKVTSLVGKYLKNLLRTTWLKKEEAQIRMLPSQHIAISSFENTRKDGKIIFEQLSLIQMSLL